MFIKARLFLYTNAAVAQSGMLAHFVRKAYGLPTAGGATLLRVPPRAMEVVS